MIGGVVSVAVVEDFQALRHASEELQNDEAVIALSEQTRSIQW